jgi:membrane protease YdiL (CAAX protease family)
VNTGLAVITHLLVATLLTTIVVTVVLSARVRGRLLALLAADRKRRIRFYRNLIVSSWATAALVPLIAVASADLSSADVGWAWPSGDGLDYLLATSVLFLLVVGGLRTRHLMRSGHVAPGRAGMAAMVPRTATERWLALGVALTAGITEEVVYRGLLIGAATRLYHLPLAVAVVVSLGLFVAAHAYQDRAGLVGVTVLGIVFTVVYVISGSLLLAIVLHVVQDIVALLVVPAEPAPAAIKPTTGTPSAPVAAPTPDAPAAPRSSSEQLPPIRSAFPT